MTASKLAGFLGIVAGAVTAAETAMPKTAATVLIAVSGVIVAVERLALSLERKN